MTEKSQTWRYVFLVLAVSLTTIAVVAIWRLPEIMMAFK